MLNNRTSALLLVSLCLPLAGPLTARPALAVTASGILETGQTYAMQSFQIAGQYLSSAVTQVSSWIPGLPSPADLLEGMGRVKGPSETDFTNMMDIAGYSVEDFTLGVGIVPETAFNFSQTREISDYDRQYLQRLLRKQKRDSGGPMALAERAIISTVLEFQGFKSFNLTRINVKLLPLPSVVFTAEPKELVFDSKTSHIVLRLDQLNEKLKSIADN